MTTQPDVTQALGDQSVGKPDLRKYKVGEKTSWGETISYVYGATRDVIVFRNPDGVTQWETTTEGVTAVEGAAHQCYNSVAEEMQSTLPPARWPDYRASLAQCLFLALCDTDLKAVPRQFDSLRTRLAEESIERGRRIYLLTGLAGAIVFAAGLPALSALPLLPDAKLILRMAGIGAIGAFASVLTRSGRLRLKPLQSPVHFASQGVGRILLGVIFGSFVAVATKGQLILGFAAGNPWALGAFAFVAGVSERFVPEIIDDLSRKTASTAAEEKEVRESAT